MNAVSAWLLQGMLESSCHRGTLVVALLHKAATLRAAISHSATFPKEAEVKNRPNAGGNGGNRSENAPRLTSGQSGWQCLKCKGYHGHEPCRAGGVTCYNCGKPRHIARDCRVAPRGSGEVYALTVDEAAFSKDPTQERKYGFDPQSFETEAKADGVGLLFVMVGFVVRTVM
ncbi:hypothetical protein PIB30_056748 [Stylosanthes scabra]|uniref:CCHC-type domain-containing protein n=1 Tax=Stylosanthes scabra TaxID=79078 RepID=A0ABU6RJR9_9FABA|nr:hypothetical protein [Stylosanthes scabra]